MTTSYLDAKEIAEIAHEAVYRAWFKLGGSSSPVAWDGLNDGPKRDARNAVSERMRDDLTTRIPTAIPTEYAIFWEAVVDAAIALQYDEGA